MKIKSLLAYCVPLFVLVLVVITVLVSVPEPWSVKACRQLPGCVAVVPGFQGWPSMR